MIAFLLWAEGSASYKPNPITGDKPHLVSWKGGVFSFRKKEIPKYMTEYFYSWMKLWKWYKKGWLPYSKGWLEHPWKIIKVCELFDALALEKGM